MNSFRAVRFFSQVAKNAEERLTNILKSKLQGIKEISVSDISNGCGSMFSINMRASEFNGLSRVAQHKLVTDILKEEIKKMHGVIIETKPAA